MSNKDLNLSLYNSKYLKYKNKYLSLKKMFGGMESDDDKKIRVTVYTQVYGNSDVFILKNEDLVSAMAKKFNVNLGQIQVIFDNIIVDKGLSAEDYGIEDYSHLTVNISNIIINTKTLFNEIVAPDIVKLNPHVTLENITKCVYNYIDVKEGPLQVDQVDIINIDDIINIHLMNLNLVELPESFGYIHVRNNLFLNNNQLETLPESFGNIRVGALILNDNQLETLPSNFGNITVKKELDLEQNKLQTLPESFGNIHVANLYLGYNNLKTLPVSFGNIHLANLFLGGNNFTIPPIKPNNVDNMYI